MTEGIPPGQFALGEINSEPFPERTFGKYEDVYDQFEDMEKGQSFPVHFDSEDTALKARPTIRRHINQKWGSGVCRMALKGSTLHILKRKDLPDIPPSHESVQEDSEPEEPLSDQRRVKMSPESLQDPAQPDIPQTPFSSEPRPRTLDVGVPESQSPDISQLPPELANQMEAVNPSISFDDGQTRPDPYAGMSDAEKMIAQLKGGT